MSINHFSSDIPETLWWTHQQQQQTPVMEPNPNSPSSNHNKLLIPQQTNLCDPHHHIWLGSLNSQEAAVAASMFRHRNTTFNFNLNQEDNEEQVDEQIPDVEKEEVLEREAMFEKPLTPSDVGKLNRLVIPKQHAEKYFPLGGDSGDKGLLLSFEDESGKCWRFRYSYWNSSQSYVLTKGWSRYVKEKRLDAGDVVLFERHRTDGDRLFIGWRRRASPAQDSGAAQPPVINTTTTNTNTTTTATTTTGGWTRVFYSAHPYPSHPLPYQPDCLHAGSVNVGQNQTTPTGNSKRLRLFGVNMECRLDESEPATPDGSSSSSQGQTPHHHQFYPETPGSSGHSLNMQDINLPRDVNLMRNRRG